MPSREGLLLRIDQKELQKSFWKPIKLSCKCGQKGELAKANGETGYRRWTDPCQPYLITTPTASFSSLVCSIPTSTVLIQGVGVEESWPWTEKPFLGGFSPSVYQFCWCPQAPSLCLKKHTSAQVRRCLVDICYFASHPSIQLAWNKDHRINPLLEIPCPRQILGYKRPTGPSTGFLFLLQPFGMLFLKVRGKPYWF